MDYITNQTDFEKFLDELYSEVTSPTVQVVQATRVAWNQLYVTIDQAKHYHVVKGKATLEITHARGILVAINKDYS